MTYVSPSASQYPIIDKGFSNSTLLQVPPGCSKGYKKRDYNKDPYGSLEYTTKFDIPLIPRDEWADRIEEMNKERALLSQLADSKKLSVLHQNGTSYCWMNGYIQAMHYLSLVMTGDFTLLSPASCAAIIKNFQNRGGWGKDAIAFLAKHGAVPQTLWPPNAIDKKYDTAEADEARKPNRLLEWYELKPRNFDQCMTAALLRYPYGAAFNWWRHLICAVDPVVMGKDEFGILHDNSWGKGWGKEGRVIFAEGKGTPDEAHAPRVRVAA